MTSYMIIDTETTGLFDFSKPADVEEQPRLAALTMIETDDTFDHALETTVLVKPDGWTISPEITAINGLTTERCEAEGVAVDSILNLYAKRIEAGAIIVAYNAQYDTKVMRGEFRRLGRDDMFERTPNICAMRACKPLGIQKAGAKKGGFPKLADAHRHFYGAEHEGQHTSFGDAQACLAVFRKLIELGGVPEAAVHYAANRPEKAAE